MTLSNIFASLPKVYLRSNTVNKTSFKAQFQPDIVSMMMMTIQVVGRNATVWLKPLPTADRGKDKCSLYLQTIFGGTFGFKGAANEKFGVQWEIWNKRPNLAPGGVLNCGENL